MVIPSFGIKVILTAYVNGSASKLDTQSGVWWLYSHRRYTFYLSPFILPRIEVAPGGDWGSSLKIFVKVTVIFFSGTRLKGKNLIEASIFYTFSLP